MKRWLVPLALALGVALGLLVAPRSSAKALPPAVAAPAVRAAVAIDQTALRAEVGRIVAQECRRIGGGDAAPSSAVPAPAPPQPTAEQLDAQDQAQDLVTRALAAGVWDADHVLALRALIPQMTSDQRDQVLGALFRALNDGRLRTTSTLPGPPF